MSSILPQHRYVSIPPGNYGYGPDSYYRTPLDNNLTTYNQSPGIYEENYYTFGSGYGNVNFRKFNESEAALWYYNIRGFVLNGQATYLPKRSFTERKKNIQEGFWVANNYLDTSRVADPQADAAYGVMPSFFYQRLGRNGVYDFIPYFFRDTYADPADDNAGNYPFQYYEELPGLWLGKESILVNFNDIEGIDSVYESATATWQYEYYDYDTQSVEIEINHGTFDLASFFEQDPNTFDYLTKLDLLLECKLHPFPQTQIYWSAYGQTFGQREFTPDSYYVEPWDEGTEITANSPLVIPFTYETRYYAGVPYYLKYPTLKSGPTQFTFEILFDE